MNKIAKIAIAVVVQAALAWALVMFVVTPMMRGEPLPWQKEPAEGEEQIEALGPLLLMDELLVNVAETEGRRFFKTSLTLEMDSPDLGKQAETRLPILRGRVIDLLAKKKMEDLTAPAARDSLRSEILDTLNAEVSAGQFHDLFFTEFLVQ